MPLTLFAIAVISFIYIVWDGVRKQMIENIRQGDIQVTLHEVRFEVDGKEEGIQTGDEEVLFHLINNRIPVKFVKKDDN